MIDRKGMMNDECKRYCSPHGARCAHCLQSGKWLVGMLREFELLEAMGSTFWAVYPEAMGIYMSMGSA